MKNDDLNQKVTERIQDQLMMILPEDEIRKRVDTVIDSFFAPVPKDQWGNNGRASAFAQIVQKHLDEKINNLLGAMFQSEQWKVSLDKEMNLQIGSAVKTILGIDENGLTTTVAKIVAARKASDLLSLVGMHIMSRNLGPLGMELQNAFFQAATDNLNAARDPSHLNYSQPINQPL